jgi:hypothetical protein
MENEPIMTELGILRVRDIIYLDSMEHKNNEIIFYGEINSELLKIKNKPKGNWIKYKLCFINILYYECCELDFYGKHKCIKSSFDIINNSELIEILKQRNNEKLNKNYKHFILSTYDYTHEIISTEYKFEINKY